MNIFEIPFVKLRLGSGTQALSGSLRLSDSGSYSVTGTRDSEPGLTLKSCRPPLPTTHHHHPPTFKHEGEVPHKNPKSKTDLE